MTDGLSIADIARITVAEREQMARDGELTGEHLWTALKGAARYLEAIAAGRVVPPAEAQARASKCQSCPSRTTRTVVVRGDTVEAFHCGRAFEERHDAAPPTCGCLLAVRINGGPLMAAGKTVVAGEESPQGKW